MKFILFIEGHTEKKALPQFLKRWFDQRLSQPVGIKTVRFEGWHDLVNEAPKKANMYLTGKQQGEIVAIISLLDLYGPTFYPADKTSAEDRYAWGKERMEKAVNNIRFRQFFAVHETEAWLFSNPDIFPNEIRNSVSLKADKPEFIDFDRPPSKRLSDLYWQHIRRSYKKVTNGRELFTRLNPGIVYSKCPKFKEMLDEMLSMAKAAGL